MGRSRVKKSAYQSWNPTVLKQAMEAVKDRGMALRKASKIYGIPKTTLKRRIDEMNKPSGEEPKLSCNKRTVFTPEQELQLKKLLLSLADTCQGFTTKEVRHLAFQFAEKNSISHRFNRERGLAGIDWFYGFKERHPEIPLRNSDYVLSTHSQYVVSQLNFVKFAESLQQALEETKFRAHQIYNADQYGVLLGEVVPRNVGVNKTDDSERLFEAVFCMSAGGPFIPPFVSLADIPEAQQSKGRVPPGTVFVKSSRGWTEPSISTAWFEHFLAYAKPSRDDPALLLVSSVWSTITESSLVARARESHVMIVTVPAEKRQPLDSCFLGLLNSLYAAEIQNQRGTNPGKPIGPVELNDLFGEAYLEASTPKAAISGFRDSGIFPFSVEVVTEVSHPSPRKVGNTTTVKRRRKEDGTDSLENENSNVPSNGSSTGQNTVSLSQHQLNFPFELCFDSI